MRHFLSLMHWSKFSVAMKLESAHNRAACVDISTYYLVYSTFCDCSSLLHIIALTKSLMLFLLHSILYLQKDNPHVLNTDLRLRCSTLVRLMVFGFENISYGAMK